MEKDPIQEALLYTTIENVQLKKQIGQLTTIIQTLQAQSSVAPNEKPTEDVPKEE